MRSLGQLRDAGATRARPPPRLPHFDVPASECAVPPRPAELAQRHIALASTMTRPHRLLRSTSATAALDAATPFPPLPPLNPSDVHYPIHRRPRVNGRLHDAHVDASICRRAEPASYDSSDAQPVMPHECSGTAVKAPMRLPLLSAGPWPPAIALEGAPAARLAAIGSTALGGVAPSRRRAGSSGHR